MSVLYKNHKTLTLSKENIIHDAYITSVSTLLTHNTINNISNK